MSTAGQHTGPSLRAHLLRWLLPPVMGIIVISSVVSYALGLRFATEAYDAALFDAARSLAQQITIAAEGPELNLPRAATEILESDPYDRIFYRVVTPGGFTVAGRSEVPLPTPPVTRAEPVRFYDAVVAGEEVRVGAYGVFHEHAEPVATVLFAETLFKRNRLSRNLLLTMVVPLFMLALVVAVGVGYTVRYALEPLHRLAESLANRSWSNLSAFGHSGVPDEIRPLTDALDALMERLSATLTMQQRFISEAAHQLRTPMAGLTSQTERALLANDIGTIKPALSQLLVSARRVTRLVNQLLTLARVEPGSAPERGFVTLDLAALVQQTSMEWVPEALQKNVDLGYCGVSSPVLMKGDELLLAEMLNNMIDNALRYGAREGGSITVRLETVPHVQLSVQDDGVGIPVTERSRVFERFHRLPGSAPGGCGLGLAIVQGIARAHNAEVIVDTLGSGRGTIFKVVFRASVTDEPYRLPEKCDHHADEAATNAPYSRPRRATAGP